MTRLETELALQLAEYIQLLQKARTEGIEAEVKGSNSASVKGTLTKWGVPIQLDFSENVECTFFAASNFGKGSDMLIEVLQKIQGAASDLLGLLTGDPSEDLKELARLLNLALCAVHRVREKGADMDEGKIAPLFALASRISNLLANKQELDSYEMIVALVQAMDSERKKQFLRALLNEVPVYFFNREFPAMSGDLDPTTLVNNGLDMQIEPAY